MINSAIHKGDNLDKKFPTTNSSLKKLDNLLLILSYPNILDPDKNCIKESIITTEHVNNNIYLKCVRNFSTLLIKYQTESANRPNLK